VPEVSKANDDQLPVTSNLIAFTIKWKSRDSLLKGAWKMLGGDVTRHHYDAGVDAISQTC
jgi:hypothetical protein